MDRSDPTPTEIGTAHFIETIVREAITPEQKAAARLKLIAQLRYHVKESTR